MNLKALITALVLAGTSTAALADSNVRDHRVETTQVAATQPSAQLDRDHRVDHRLPRWMTLASSSQLSRGRDVISANARISTLKLVALKGSTTINSVTVKFANGATQKIRLAQTLAPQSQPITIDLKGAQRNVVSIVVSGNSSRRASFEVLGA